MELAVCLPLLVTLVLGSIEVSNAIFLKQSLTTAAYEGAQVTTCIGGTEAEARTRINEVLTAHGISRATVSISPKVDSDTEPGTPITVTVTAPLGVNSPTFAFFFSPSGTLHGMVTMDRL